MNQQKKKTCAHNFEQRVLGFSQASSCTNTVEKLNCFSNLLFFCTRCTYVTICMNHALECLFECCKWWQSLASLLKFTYTYMCLRRRRRRRRMQRRPSGAVRDDAGAYVYTTLHVHTRARRPHQLLHFAQLGELTLFGQLFGPWTAFSIRFGRGKVTGR